MGEKGTEVHSKIYTYNIGIPCILDYHVRLFQINNGRTRQTGIANLINFPLVLLFFSSCKLHDLYICNKLSHLINKPITICQMLFILYVVDVNVLAGNSIMIYFIVAYMFP